MSPGRAGVQDMDADHGRLYAAMAKKFLDRADTVAPSSGCVAAKWPLRVRSGRERTLAPWSTYHSTANETDPDVGLTALSGRCTVTSLTTAPSQKETISGF